LPKRTRNKGANAATKSLLVPNNVERILAIKLPTATQASAFRRPFKSSEIVEEIHEKFRLKVAFNDSDRVLPTEHQISRRFFT